MSREKAYSDVVPLRPLTDCHAHLSLLEARMGTVAVESIRGVFESSAGSALIVDVGIESGDFMGRKNAYGSLPFVRLSAGIWPDTEALRRPRECIGELEGHVADPLCFAVGECGLDYHWMNGTKDAQRELFSAQLDLAKQYRKPLIVHSRDAHDDTLAVLRSFSLDIPVVLHCFSYGLSECKTYIDLGCFISFAGNITYKTAETLREAVAYVPDERFLLETDSPYMAPQSKRGKICSPLDIAETYEIAARTRRQDTETLITVVAANAKNLFS